MRFSTILHWSGMWFTMLVMLSSEVRTSVGPNTMARLRGSIWTDGQPQGVQRGGGVRGFEVETCAMSQSLFF